MVFNKWYDKDSYILHCNSFLISVLISATSKHTSAAQNKIPRKVPFINQSWSKKLFSSHLLNLILLYFSINNEKKFAILKRIHIFGLNPYFIIAIMLKITWLKRWFFLRDSIGSKFSVRLISNLFTTIKILERRYEHLFILNCIYPRVDVYLYNRKCNWFYTWSNVLNVTRYVEASSALTAVLRCE